MVCDDNNDTSSLVYEVWLMVYGCIFVSKIKYFFCELCLRIINLWPELSANLKNYKIDLNLDVNLGVFYKVHFRASLLCLGN